jgi:large subunit ribosomal protein L9
MAKRQEVLLVQDVLKLGNMGDTVKVSPGYARNYLYPFELAIPASAAHKRQIEVLRERASKMEVEREGKAGEQRKKLDGLTLRIGARVVTDNELFGSIGPRDIVLELAKLGHKLDSKQVHLHDKLKKIGTFGVELRLHKKVSANISIEIFNSDPNALTLAETLAPAKPVAAVAAAAAPAAPETKPAKSKVKNLGKASEPKPAAASTAAPAKK